MTKKRELYFHENLARIRRMRGFTLETLSERLGKKRNSINRYEKDASPPVEVIAELSHILNVDLHKLFFLKNYDPTEHPTPSLSVVGEDASSYGDLKKELLAYKAQLDRNMSDFMDEVRKEIQAAKEAS